MLQGEREITLRFLAEPTDINFEGKVRSGAVIKWIDWAGYACSVGWSGQYCVTVYVGAIRFYKPVLIDNVAEVSAKLIYMGWTSVHVTVEVSAGDPKEARLTKNQALPDRPARPRRSRSAWFWLTGPISDHQRPPLLRRARSSCPCR